MSVHDMMCPRPTGESCIEWAARHMAEQWEREAGKGGSATVDLSVRVAEVARAVRQHDAALTPSRDRTTEGKP